MGFAYGVRGEHEKQIEWLLKAMRLYDKIDDPAVCLKHSAIFLLPIGYWEKEKKPLIMQKELL